MSLAALSWEHSFTHWAVKLLLSTDVHGTVASERNVKVSKTWFLSTRNSESHGGDTPGFNKQRCQFCRDKIAKEAYGNDPSPSGPPRNVQGCETSWILKDVGAWKVEKGAGNGDEGGGEVLQVEGARCTEAGGGQVKRGGGTVFRSWGTRKLCCRVCIHESMGSYRIILSKQIMGLVLHFRKIKNDWKGINPWFHFWIQQPIGFLRFASQLPSLGLSL